MSKNIFYQLMAFSIAALMSPAVFATEQCEALPDCASIGYTFTEQQCGDLLKIKCPFGNAYFCSKANCSTYSGYYDTEEECAGTGFVCAEDVQSGCWVKSGCNSAEGYYENAPTDSYLTYSTISVEGVTCYYNIHCDEDQKYFDSNPGTAACSSLTPPDGSGWWLKPIYANANMVPEGSRNCWQCIAESCEHKTTGQYWSTNAVPSSFSCNTPTTMIISIGDYTPTDALDAANHNALCVKRTCSSTPVSCSAYTETNGWISYTSGTATAACIAKYGTGYASTDTTTCNNTKYTKCAPATTCSALGYMDGSSLGTQNNLEYLYKEVSVNGLTCYDKTDKKAFSDFAATSSSKWVNTSLHCDPDLTGYENDSYPVEAFYGTTQTSSSNICGMVIQNGHFTYYTTYNGVPCKATVGTSVYKGFTANNSVLLQSDELVTTGFRNRYVCCGDLSGEINNNRYYGWREYSDSQSVQSTSCVLPAHQTGAPTVCGLCYMR